MMTYAELFLILSCSVLLFCRAGNSGSSLLKKSLPFAVCILAACLPASASLGADRVQTPPESAVLNPTMKNGEKEMKKAPIDTVFAQGEPNPYGQFFTGQQTVKQFLSRIRYVFSQTHNLKQALTAEDHE